MHGFAGFWVAAMATSRDPKANTSDEVPRGDAIDAAGITVGGGAHFDEGFLARGAVLLQRAKIGGGLHCDGGTLSNPGRIALTAIFASVSNEVRMSNGFVAEGIVNFDSADVHGQINCTSGSFLNPRSDALILDNAHVIGLVVLQEAALAGERTFVARGCVRLTGARLDAGFECIGATFVENSGRALMADRARIAGSVVLARCTVLGEVSFSGAKVGRQFSLPGTRILNRGKVALRAQGLTVDGGVLLNTIGDQRFRAFGEIDLSYSTIHLALDCSYCRLSQRAGTALDLSHSTVIGSVNLSNGVYVGVLDFESMRIDGDLYFTGAIANNPEPQEGENLRSISFKNTSIRGSLEWFGVRVTAATNVLFTNANLGAFLDDPESWPELGRLDLRGMTYSTLKDISPTADARLEWLRLQGPKRFSLQPYEELIAWARRNGREQDAVRIAIARQDDLRRYGQLGPVAAGWNWFLGKSMAHGYEPLRVVYAAAVFILIGWFVFGYGAALGVMVPTKLEGSPQTLSPLVYSLDTFLPVIDFHQESYWLPSSSTALGRAIRTYLWIHIGMGWALTTLAVIGFTGLVRKK
jgi:hypothetical protein